MGNVAKKDGRRLRAERSRRAVAESMLELIRRGEARPTAAAVAGGAGVSLRLVFHHYKDMDAVFRHALQLQAARLAPMVPVSIPQGASLDEKIAIVVAHRATLYEELTPVRRAARLAESSSALIADGLERFRKLKREQISFCFREELEDKPPGRQAFVQAAASWMTWESLRAHQGLGVESAKAALSDSLHSLLAYEGACIVVAT